MCNIIGKGTIAKGTFPQMIAVAPYSAVFIDSVKNYTNALSPVFLRQGKVYPIPADPPARYPVPLE